MDTVIPLRGRGRQPGGAHGEALMPLDAWQAAAAAEALRPDAPMAIAAEEPCRRTAC